MEKSVRRPGVKFGQLKFVFDQAEPRKKWDTHTMTEVDLAKKSALDNMEMFLRNFSHVPDEYLNFQVTPTAKSPLRIAAHTALYASRFAKMIRERATPVPENLDQWLAARNAEEIAVSTREEVDSIFRTGTQEVLDALDTLTPKDIESSVNSGQGWSMSMRFMMGLPGWHAAVHMGQIDFLQTCWNDQEVYVG